ncbi:hypothetical protein K474DRAFT_1705869, partial [Panus rudis PR-1116 ss-1]
LYWEKEVFPDALDHNNTPAGGQASMVWFTQASILQSANLPDDVHTVDEAKKKNYVATYDVEKALREGIFPIHL